MVAYGKWIPSLWPKVYIFKPWENHIPKWWRQTTHSLLVFFTTILSLVITLIIYHSLHTYLVGFTDWSSILVYPNTTLQHIFCLFLPLLYSPVCSQSVKSQSTYILSYNTKTPAINILYRVKVYLITYL